MAEPRVGELLIRNFMGLENCRLENLGRVNMLVGRNGAGKTSVLNAVAAWASRGRPSVLIEMLERARSGFPGTHGDPGVALTSLLFKGAREGMVRAGHDLRIAWLSRDEVEPEVRSRHPEARHGIGFVRIGCGNGEARTHPAVPPSGYAAPGRDWVDVDAFPHAWARPDARRGWFGQTDASAREIAAAWGFSRIGASRARLVEADAHGEHWIHREKLPVGGAEAEMLDVAFAAEEARGGFLLLDCVPSTLHYARLGQFWREVFTTAMSKDVQVFAAAQSLDSLRGFGEAWSEFGDDAGSLHRLDRSRGGLKPVSYSMEALGVALEQDIEFR